MASYGTADIEVSAPAARPRSAARTAALAGVGSVLLFSAAVLATGATPRSVASLISRAADRSAVLYDDEYTPNDPVHPADDVDDDGSANSAGYPTTQTAEGDAVDNSWADAVVEIDLRKYPYVQEFLEQRNVTATTPEEVVLDYVPKLKLRYNTKRSAGNLGAQALSGYVVMCLDASGVSNAETMVRTASLMLVIDMKGEVIAVRPTPGYGTMGIQPIQMNALKMRDP